MVLLVFADTRRQKSGIRLAILLVISICLSGPGTFSPSVHAAAAPLFSVTLIVPITANTVRIEYAKEITRNMIALGIDAKLVQLSFNDTSKRLFFSKATQGATYAAGGYDIGFIGWGFQESNMTAVAIGSLQNIDGRSQYWAPNGNNYALYNSTQVNNLIDQFRSESNATEQIHILSQIQEIVFHDKPYNYIHESKGDVPGNMGWQEQAFNMKHPVFGTGVATPLGQSYPSRAAEAARHVRAAISDLIPRGHIVNDLLGGSSYELATWVGPAWGQWYNSTFTPDSFDLNAAAAELRAAGYQVASIAAAIPLVAGWNMISLPVIPSDNSITSILAQLRDPSTGTSEATIAWSYTGTGSSRSWMSYVPGTGGSLTTMVDGNGYWIFMKSADTLYVLGNVIAPASIPPTYSLVAGWNLVGFKPQPSVGNETVSAYLYSINGSYDTKNIWVLDNSSGNWIRATGSTWLVPGEAMWIIMTAPGTLRP